MVKVIVRLTIYTRSEFNKNRSTYLRNRSWLREKGSNLQSLRSKRSVLPVTPSRKRPVQSLKSKVQSLFLGADFGLFTLDFGLRLVAAAGIEPASLDYRSRALPLSYTAKCVQRHKSNVQSLSLFDDFGLSTLDFGQ